MPISNSNLIAVCWIIAALLPTVRADVTLPHVFTNHMVLQRDVETTLWGWADPDESVSVSFGKQKFPAVTPGASGQWSVDLPAQSAGGPVAITITGNNTITLENVVFGDVWLCSGQSNMVFQMFKTDGGRADVSAADYPNIRLFTVGHATAGTPQDDCKGRWIPCSAKTLGPFSAVGFYFGKALHEKLNVPIGLINSAYGGTPAEAWTPRAALAADPAFDALLQRPVDYAASYAERVKQHEASLAQWKKAEGKRSPRPPRAPLPPGKDPRMACVLYNAKIHPLTTLRIKGAIWYQGENNASRAKQYHSLLPAMIESWRAAWGQGDFPFGIVQLANYRARSAEPRDEPWARLREAQAVVAQRTVNCGLAVAIDIGDAGDIHPTNKRDVGHRLSLWALAKVYGRDITYSGPVYENMRAESDAIRITFKHVGGGLTAKGGEALKGFAIAGADRKFVWADATIDGNSIVVRSPQVAAPVAVRYAWLNNPECNLYNKADLPAVPFRTDDW